MKERLGAIIGDVGHAVVERAQEATGEVCEGVLGEVTTAVANTFGTEAGQAVCAAADIATKVAQTAVKEAGDALVENIQESVQGTADPTAKKKKRCCCCCCCC